MPCEKVPTREFKDIENAFTYHPPQGSQTRRYNHLRSLAKILAKDIVINCPESRERSLALTKVEEAVMWANAAIARNETTIPEGVKEPVQDKDLDLLKSLIEYFGG